MQRQKKIASLQGNRRVPQLEVIKIAFQCDDILKTIFKHLPTLKTVKLVCKQFYQVAEEMRQEKGWLWIKNGSFVDDQALFQSMLNTEHVFHNFAVGESSKISAIDYHEISDDFLTDQWYFKAIRTVIGIRHGQEVRQLQLMNLDISLKNLLNLLVATPNIQLLKLFFVNKTDLIRTNQKMKDSELLPEISDIIIYECDSAMARLIGFLPADSIRSLTIKTGELEHLKIGLKRQKSIKKMNLMSEIATPIPVDLLKNLMLTHLTLSVERTENLSELFAQQTSLVFLDVSATVIDDKSFLKITKLLNIEELIVNISGVSLGAFASITNLKNIKCLSLSGGTNQHFKALIHLENFSLEKLDDVSKSAIEELERKV